MCAPAIQVGRPTIHPIGEYAVSRDCLGSLIEFLSRMPSNCAYTSLAYPACLEYGQSINTRGPRPHHLLNSGLVVLHPSISTFGRIKAFLDTSPLVRNFIFPDQDLLAVFFQGKMETSPFHLQCSDDFKVAIGLMIVRQSY